MRKLLVLLLLILLPNPASAGVPAGTFLRAIVHVDVTGRTELSLHKAYVGKRGPIQDIIPLEEAGPDGYPKIEIRTSGAVQAVRERGRIVVTSTAEGLGEVDLFITHNRPKTAWGLQMADSPGVGPVKLNVTVEFGNGMHALSRNNGITIRTGQDEQMIREQRGSKLWTANASELDPGAHIQLEVAGEPDQVAPLWVAVASVTLAIGALTLAAYVAFYQRRA